MGNVKTKMRKALGLKMLHMANLINRKSTRNTANLPPPFEAEAHLEGSPNLKYFQTVGVKDNFIDTFSLESVSKQESCASPSPIRLKEVSPPSSPSRDLSSRCLYEKR